ncbi:MAG: hypothetical protein SFU98_21780 [Leptospiraceae bacterium]|nr:hypothetical protein [Leptospiraceae bacterium]
MENLLGSDDNYKNYEHFWDKVYPTLTLEERKSAWIKLTYSYTRDIDLEDSYEFLNKENYDLWKTKYQDMDQILNAVIDFISGIEGDVNGEIAKKLNQRLGRG